MRNSIEQINGPDSPHHQGDRGVHLDQLTISILFGTGIQRPEIGAVLGKLPQLKLLDQTTDPQSFVGQHTRVCLRM